LSHFVAGFRRVFQVFAVRECDKTQVGFVVFVPELPATKWTKSGAAPAHHSSASDSIDARHCLSSYQRATSSKKPLEHTEVSGQIPQLFLAAFNRF
jgi:hypothetical protein